MESVETDAVADIQPFGFVVTPWKNVGGDEEFPDGQAGHTTTVGEVVENDLSEVVLSPTLFGESLCFGIASRRVVAATYSGAGNDFYGFVFRFHEEGVEQLLT